MALAPALGRADAVQRDCLAAVVRAHVDDSPAPLPNDDEIAGAQTLLNLHSVNTCGGRNLRCAVGRARPINDLQRAPGLHTYHGATGVPVLMSRVCLVDL